MTGAIATSLTNPTLNWNWIFILEIKFDFPSLGRKSMEIFLSLKLFYPGDDIISIRVREIFLPLRWNVSYPCEGNLFFPKMELSYPRERFISVPGKKKWKEIFCSWNGNSKKLQYLCYEPNRVHVDIKGKKFLWFF